MTAKQLCLQPTQQLGSLLLSKDELDYLAWAKQQETEAVPVIDIVALKEMGLSEDEIEFLEIISGTQQKFHTPAGCKLLDTSRYLLWDLRYFPKTDKATGKITIQSFLNSTTPSYYPSKGNVNKEDYFLSIRYTVKHAIDGRYPDSALLRIYKKVLSWCLDFEYKHGLKEKETVVYSSDDTESEPEVVEATMLGPTETTEPPKQVEAYEEMITNKQKGYLVFLASTIQNDKLRQDLVKRLNLLTKQKASKIIGALVDGKIDEVASFF
jgi:hypothetical protein